MLPILFKEKVWKKGFFNHMMPKKNASIIGKGLHMYNNFIFAGWTVFNRKINIFEIINLQLSNLDKSVDQPANF